MSANRSSAGERSHRALIPHANFRKRAPLVPSPFPEPPRSSRALIRASFVASYSSTTVITRYIAFRTNHYPPATGNAPIEPSAGKNFEIPVGMHHSSGHRAIAKKYNIILHKTKNILNKNISFAHNLEKAFLSRIIYN